MKLVVIFGPPAVGKMAVGRELAKLIGFKLFHNHMTIELVLEFFDYGTQKFNILNQEFRRRIFEEVASSDLPGMIFTYVWALDEESDKRYVNGITQLFKENGGKIFYVELEATLEERLKRNVSELRLQEKPSKRDTELSQKRLLRTEKKYKMNTDNDFFYQENYIKINSTKLSAEETAKLIKKEFNF